jgi:hypothetical protein
MDRTLVPFYLLRPDELPRLRGELAEDRDTARIVGPLSEALARGLDDATVLETARAALCELAFGPADFSRVEHDPGESFESRANDLSFGIVRVRGRATRVLAHGAIQSFAHLIEDARDAGTDLDAEHWGRLRHAFTTMFSVLASGSPATLPAVPVAPGAAADPAGRDALRRWVRGHHAFMSIVQCLIVILEDFEDAFESSDAARMLDALSAASAIMWGTESALRFAGDFAYAAYERAVRPTLMPPIAPPGMTGLHWRDHRYMITVLARTRRCFARLAPGLHPALGALHTAMSAAYESHKYVCASFVGDERPSLLMASRSEKTAIETLDHFKAIRLALLDGSRKE